MGPINRTLILANVAVFLLQLQLRDAILVPFALWPLGVNDIAAPGLVAHFALWQLVTSAFLHGGTAHLALNMFALWMFGRDCERVLGARRYLGLYFAAVLSSALLQLVVSSFSESTAPTIGASGGVFGVMLAYAMMFPDRRIMLLFPPVPMPARVFVALYAGIELANGVMGTQAGVAHFAHLGGMLGAWLLLRRWRLAPK